MIVFQAITGTSGPSASYTYGSRNITINGNAGLQFDGAMTPTDIATFQMTVVNAIASNATARQAFNNVTVLCGEPGDSVSSTGGAPPVAGQLTPANVQVNLVPASGGSLTFGNNNGPGGNITFGTQIVGNGAAIVSSGDIDLIGTSSQLSSTPSAQLGLNLYAEGNVLIDAYKLDTAGNGTFHDVNLQGVLYSWGNTTINVGNPATASWGNFTMDGVMVSYGGNPAGGVLPYAGTNSPGKTSISANMANITYNPAYVMGLYQNLPVPLPMRVLAWHER